MLEERFAGSSSDKAVEGTILHEVFQVGPPDAPADSAGKSMRTHLVSFSPMKRKTKNRERKKGEKGIFSALKNKEGRFGMAQCIHDNGTIRTHSAG